MGVGGERPMVKLNTSRYYIRHGLWKPGAEDKGEVWRGQMPGVESESTKNRSVTKRERVQWLVQVGKANVERGEKVNDVKRNDVQMGKA